MPKLISVVIPVFNEEGNVPVITKAVQNIFEKSNYSYEIIFVDDGSVDNTMQMVKNEASKNGQIFFISFSKNFTKDNALLAGFKYAKGDALVTIDADMQHPPEMIADMLQFWEEGYEVVYAYRENKNEFVGAFNRITSRLFYKLMSKLSDVKMEDGLSDYRLIDRKVINILKDLHEDHLFFRGLIKWVGFRQKGISYLPKERHSGSTKYNKKSLIKLALHSITSFSTKPLVSAIYLGFTFSLLSLLYIPYVVFSLIYENAISGWASIIVTIVFFSGLQLMILGILGMYLGKVFMQGKQRPHFIIRETNIS